MHAERIERKYALTKIAAGDYLMPSNDGKTLWRFALYTDGPTHGLEIPSDRDFWGAWRWRHEITTGVYIDTTDWDCWDLWAGGYETRGDAIKDALRHV